MGREQDLLDAGRNGNLAVIEKILNIKQKKSGPLGQLQGAIDSLRRPVNPNCQDANGDTALHLAALNGHRQAVVNLLQYETSANIIDNKGCQPLHLAAWNGHADICKDLLTHGPSFANVDEQNHDGETALLCASQYGHTSVVSNLLEGNANCSIRNNRGESPLDLACQYGRIETVKLLLEKRPQLVNDLTENISPLHLASRNGHKAIVQLLIESGFDINTKTESGSALHEAALFGKEDVVLFLLERGIDVYLTDSTGRSAVEVLSDHKSQKSLHIGNSILAHLERLGLSPTKPRPASNLSYLDNNSRPVSISDLYSTPQKVQRERGLIRDRLESASSTTSSQLECPPIPEYRTSRPVSDPIYDIPQPHSIPLPNTGRSPALSESSLHSPHGSPSSLCSSPGRSPKSKHVKPSKPPRRKIAKFPISEKGESSHVAYGSPLSASLDRTEAGKSPGSELSNVDRPQTLDVKPKVIHANVTAKVQTFGIGSDTRAQINPQPTAYQDSGEYVSLASIAEIHGKKSTKPTDDRSGDNRDVIHGKVNIAKDKEEINTQSSSVVKKEGSEDLDDRNPVFVSASQEESVTSPSTMKDIASKHMKETSSTTQKQQESSKETQLSKGSSLQGMENVSPTALAIQGECDNKSVVQNANTVDEAKEDMQENNNNNNLCSGKGRTLSDAVDNVKKKEAIEDNSKLHKSGSTTPSTRPSSLEITGSSKRSSQEICDPAPLSPTGYQQPPTPDHPPPSPMTALQGIHAKIKPLEKRRSRDMETITETEFLADISTEVSKAKMTDSQTETDLAEALGQGDPDGEPNDAVVMRRKSEKMEGDDILTNGSDPFVEDCPECLTKGAVPFGQRRVKSQIYENVIVHPIAKLKKRLSTPGASMSFDPSTFDPVLEKDELLQRSGEGLESPDSNNIVSDNMQNKRRASPTDNSSISNNKDLPNNTDKLNIEDNTGSSESQNSSMGVRDGEDIVQNLNNVSLDKGIDRHEEVLDTSGTAHKEAQSLDGRKSDVPRRESYKKRIKSDRTEDVMMSSMEENEEWAQISDLIKSAGGRMSTAGWQDYAFYEKQLQELFAKDKDSSATMQSVGDWLDSLGLSQYENAFIANGYDDMEFMGPNVLEYADLLEIGVCDEGHIKTILEAANTIPAVKYIGDDPTPQSVGEWLESLQLPEYVQTFRMNGFNTIDRVQHVWELELNSVLDIATYGHRKRILASLRNPYTPRSSVGSAQDLNLADADLTHNTPSSSSIGKSISHGSSEDEEHLFKDYTKSRSSHTLPTKSKSRTSHSLPSNKKFSATTTQKNLQRSYSENDTVFEDSSAIDIRPPNTSQVRNWKHRPEVLIRGCCNYNAQYLGSTLVKNLVGLESTKESISRMKKSTAGIGKIPTILLSISYKGVKFIDAKSKNVICEHEIGNIFCACQDGDNLNYFAYITKDLQTSKLYCHVFSVKNTELATEIILTLGEAFEVAYQMALRDQRLQSQSNTQGEPATGGALQKSMSTESDV